MTLLQQLKELRKEGYAEAKKVYPFIRCEALLYIYDRKNTRLNDGIDHEVSPLTKANLASHIDYIRTAYPNADEINLEFVFRGADTMQEFEESCGELVDTASEMKVSEIVMKIPKRKF